METKQAFKILSKICLNNWHYIDRKVLSLNKEVNFFTGHSGSGKSTVIDALQIVLYANTDGRGFFNKAAADDSDRSLIEYLRGMVNISDNNESQYRRNKNFSSTIVLEFTNSATGEQECVGIVFDVETATNEISRLFFWHQGPLLSNLYRGEGRVLSTVEVREYLQRNFPQDGYYCGPSNERFRRQLYDVYLGGLDKEKFPRLFKRAIPFRMNIRLEDFVKEYICMEQDIEIQDMQESVMRYGQMRSKIEATLKEIQSLTKIEESFSLYEDKKTEEESWLYRALRLEILQLRRRLEGIRDRRAQEEKEKKEQQKLKEKTDREAEELQRQYEDIIVRIAQTGYEELKDKLSQVNLFLEHLSASRSSLQKTRESMEEWKKQDMVSNSMLRDIERLCQGSITEEELQRLKENFADIRRELEEERGETGAQLRSLKKEMQAGRQEIADLKQGKKAYPRELEEARYYIREELQRRAGKFVNVQILADMLEVKDETWHNAVEGYLGNNKLSLMVEPAYAREAMEIYETMDKKKFWRAAVVDTERLMQDSHPVREGALAEEVKAGTDYAQAYTDFLLGRVIKCRDIDELRQQTVGITPGCMLYKSYKLQHIDPENYTERACIGENSLRKRRKRLEEKLEKLEKQRVPLEERQEEIRSVLAMDYLDRPAGEYLSMIRDIRMIGEKEKEREMLQSRIEELKEENVGRLEREKEELRERQTRKKQQADSIQKAIWQHERRIQEADQEYLDLDEELNEKQKSFKENEEFAESFQSYMESRKSSNYEYLKNLCFREQAACREEREKRYQELVDIRSSYLREYPHRTFSASAEDNGDYEKLLNTLQCDHLEEYKEKAAEQARTAVQHFKEDFIYKIRSAIKEALQRKDELNRIISRLDFGKDKYQFVITRNKGAYGEYYDMFMDDALEIDPSRLSYNMENQMNLFTMEHEEKYGELIGDLIQIFIPPENASAEELEEAKQNMRKYSDYRTYLSFDMQQIVRGEKNMHIGLGKMISKNSGGEGQNPLYVALLASFAQLYRLDYSPRVRRNPTIRLVILDEAFSKMDAEKVATCIELIRGLGFQAIISATNDKIQNYLENVDKTFVFANPDKQNISIMEFEKQEFEELLEEAEE